MNSRTSRAGNFSLPCVFSCDKTKKKMVEETKQRLEKLGACRCDLLINYSSYSMYIINCSLFYDCVVIVKIIL